MEQQQNSQPLTEMPKKKIYKKWQFWIACIVVIIIVLVIGMVIWYFSIDIDSESSGAIGEIVFIGKTYKFLYENKCKLNDSIPEQWGWSGITCFPRSSKANSDCIQNSDCQGGMCRPSEFPRGIGNTVGVYAPDQHPRLNQDGFILGTCSEADYSNYIGPEFGIFCGSSITRPSTLDDTSGIGKMFCS